MTRMHKSSSRSKGKDVDPDAISRSGFYIKDPDPGSITEVIFMDLNPKLHDINGFGTRLVQIKVSKILNIPYF